MNEQGSLSWLLQKGIEDFIGIDKIYDYFKNLFRDNTDLPQIHNEPLSASAVTVAVPLERALTVTRFPVTVLAALLVTLPRDRTLASLTDHTAFRPVERRRTEELPTVSVCPR